MGQHVERFEGFNYHYRMGCECGGAVVVTAATYFTEQSVDALVPCDSCGGRVHFGPAVALIRNTEDLALDDDRVSEFAWYHTSTWRDWPSIRYASAAEADARSTAEWFRLDPTKMVERARTKALHVGTYEAAIENMLRRMRYQGDGASQFYLHRVTINVESGRIEPGYRDENQDEAAQLTTSDLDEFNVDVVRYVNVCEATGSVSLAVRPECIEATQCLPIPIYDLALRPSASLSIQLEAFAERQRELDHARGSLPELDHVQLWQMKSGRKPDPDGVARRIEDVDHLGYTLWTDIRRALVDAFLDDVSPVVADDFEGAMSAWKSAAGVGEVRRYAERFAAMAALLTRSPDVVDVLTKQPSVTPEHSTGDT